MSDLGRFEKIVRRAFRFTDPTSGEGAALHPFEIRNIHSDLPAKTRRLFDDGHYAEATFEAFKFMDEEIQRLAASSEIGWKLMMGAFGFDLSKGRRPVLELNPLQTATEEGEQEGFQFLFGGSVRAIRNPRAHTSGVSDAPDLCLDHLSLASMLLRRLEEAGLR